MIPPIDTHLLERSQFLPLPRETVFAFFSDAANLARITPPKMGFCIRTPGPVGMRQGTRIEYGIRVFGMPMLWESLISRWDPPHAFVDEQLSGPYKQWIHTHQFEERDGGTLVVDQVRYRMPFWAIGELAHPLVRWQLNHIFCYRQKAIERILLSS